ncbi:MAG: acylphosphatase [Phycisphaera sp.]|nr:MAG: acylphosphatase [Phycisphaera sp.]
MERRSVRFTGRVQGVGFRMTARAVAQSLKLSGWVRNEPDGSVLMEVQGPPNTIEQCLGRIQRETFGHVDDRQELTQDVDDSETGFEIRH